jgi:hypothetical protein
MIISVWVEESAPRVDVHAARVFLRLSGVRGPEIIMTHRELRQLAAALTEAITRLPAGGDNA